MKRNILLLLLFALAEAQAQTTLDEYRSAVENYSWSLKSARAESDRAAQVQLQARTSFLPALSIDRKSVV